MANRRILSTLFFGAMVSCFLALPACAADWRDTGNGWWRTESAISWVTDDGYLAPYGNWHELYGKSDVKQTALKLLSLALNGQEVKVHTDAERDEAYQITTYLCCALGVNTQDNFIFTAEDKYYTFHDGEALAEEFRENIAYVEQFIPDKGLSPLEKANHIEEEITKAIRYDYSGENQFLNATVEDGFGVCSSFAAAEYLAALGSGIPARYVYGKADGNPHSWVLLYLDGKWVPRDPTNREVILYDAYGIPEAVYRETYVPEQVF